MKPPLAYRILRYRGSFYPQYQRKSWFALLGRKPVWCTYDVLSFVTEEDALGFIAQERDAWRKVDLPTIVVREISA